jgi:hypothetical protein
MRQRRISKRTVQMRTVRMLGAMLGWIYSHKTIVREVELRSVIVLLPITEYPDDIMNEFFS